MLDAVAKAYPSKMSRDTISRMTPYKRSSRDTFLQKLRARDLVTTSGEWVTAADALFDP